MTTKKLPCAAAIATLIAAIAYADDCNPNVAPEHTQDVLNAFCPNTILCFSSDGLTTISWAKVLGLWLCVDRQWPHMC